MGERSPFAIISFTVLGIAWGGYWLSYNRNEQIARAVSMGANPLETACSMGSLKSCQALLKKQNPGN